MQKITTTKHLINKIMKKLLAKFIEYRFTDVVNGRRVNLYECKDGTRFLAHSKLESIFFSVTI